MKKNENKKLRIIANYILGISFILFSYGISNAQKSPSTKGMNVIFIMADDLGWSDTELYGTTSLYKTKNIERLAERGLTFTNAYAASPLCSPTRATILSGQSSARNGVLSAVGHLPTVHLKPKVSFQKTTGGDKASEVASATRLNTDLPTLGKLLKNKGYATGHFGKWHLGTEPYSPLEHGFDVDIPHTNGPGPGGGYLAPWSYKNFKPNSADEHIEDRMSKEAVAWMNAMNGDQPFYMNYWMFSVHGPWGAKEDLIDKYRRKIDTTQLQRSPSYAAMVHSLDDAVGTLLDEVDRLGITDNTVIIFFSDNGGTKHIRLREHTTSGEEFHARVTHNTPLKGGKATMFEGGIRVPCVIVWPGLTSPGSRTDARIQSTDFYPTLLNLLGASIPKDHLVDGVDFSPVFHDSNWQRNQPMFSYFPAPPRGVPDWLPPAMSVHDGDWKLIRLFHQGENQEHDYLLYNLVKDIGETNNLASKHPKRVKEMDALIEIHIEETNSIVPLLNPNFNPAKYQPELIGISTQNQLLNVNAKRRGK
nr:N-acetylgalactosamine 6-sulfatase [uncultured bacterium]|tara:strand:- start:324 stop:1922 length:1599 start_codon:yes stop_codon:yes gene_type:complete